MNITKAMQRDERNDANEMVSLELERRDGLKPAQRLAIRMDAECIEPLGYPEWNARANRCAIEKGD